MKFPLVNHGTDSTQEFESLAVDRGGGCEERDGDTELIRDRRKQQYKMWSTVSPC